jgi:hypothetical protein
MPQAPECVALPGVLGQARQENPEVAVDELLASRSEVDTDIKKDTLRKRMEKRGWQFDGKGKWGVPRTLNVHIVEHQKMHTQGVFIGEVDEGVYQTLTANELVPTVQRYDPDKPVVAEPWADVVELAKRVAELKNSKTEYLDVRGPGRHGIRRIQQMCFVIEPGRPDDASAAARLIAETDVALFAFCYTYPVVLAHCKSRRDGR